MTKVIIVGGNYAGCIAAKKLAKKGHEIVIVSPFDSSFASPLLPRLLTEPELIEGNYNNKYTSIFAGLNVKHVKALVTELDPDAKVLTLSTGETLDYEHLVIATGTSHGELFKPSSSGAMDSNVSLIKSTAEKIKSNKNIAVIGGGPTGVEVSGDIAHHYPDKSVDLYTGSGNPLPTLPLKKQLQAVSMLEKKGVKVIKKNAEISGNTVDGKSYDLVLTTFGVKPNSGFIPKKLLNSEGYLKVSEDLTVPGYTNILGFGDITDTSNNTLVAIILGQTKTLEKSAEKYFEGKSVNPPPYKNPKGASMFVPVGKDGGVGIVFGWSIPSFLVKIVKAKDYMISHMANYYDQF
ncbi:putative oxidoreductase Ptalp [[Candida] jaroonii]|uniref:Oxidoreductase Ptalp n=1 Tax=[Candida] jaroonii TaxID=467808 RepID=A0ACA9Y190_9ASCO|nr:putative oxidoreductase Ptalp [[Candida] jaroonii]